MKKIILLLLILLIFITIVIGQKGVQKVAVKDSNGQNVANRIVFIFRQAAPCICDSVVDPLACKTNLVTKGTTDKNGQVKISGLIKDTNYVAALDFTCTGRCHIQPPSCNPRWVRAVAFELSNDFVTLTDTLPFRKKGNKRSAGDSKTEGFEIFPNPALKKIDVRVGSMEGVFQLHIYTYVGQQIISKEILLQRKGTFTIDISSFVPGMYSVILTNNSVRFRRSFLKL